MENSQGDRFYYPQLDGLRFFAFLLVFIHNAPYSGPNKFWNALHEYGWVGVDIFFCLTAYLLTKIIILEYNKNKEINVKKFYYRRALRIYPAYFTYLMLATIFIINNQGWQPIIAQHIIGLSTFSYNFVYLFLTHKAFFVFFHLWTISYEMQFYFIIPWAIKLLINKKNLVKIILLMLFLFGSIIRVLLIYYQSKHPIIYMLPFTHFESILGGIIIGSGLLKQFNDKFQVELISFLGIALLITIFLLPNMYIIDWGLMLIYPVVGLGSTLILYRLISQPKTFLMSIFTLKPIVFLGKISYGLYLYHLISISIVFQVLNSITNKFDELISSTLFIGGMSLTILLAILSYKIIERPFLIKKTLLN